MIDISDTLIRSYERDLKAGVAVGAVKKHALGRIARLRKDGKTDVANKLDLWVNTTL